jgi:hypothetical protein
MTSGVRGKSTISLPRHHASTFLPPRSALRTKYTTGMGRTSPDDTPAQAQTRVVAYSARPAQRPFKLQTHRETAYLHADSSGYGWGAVLNDNPSYHARSFWYDDDRHQHITWKELRAVRLAIEAFLPQLRGRNVLLHVNNTAVVATLSKLTTRSPLMMTELRRLWHLRDVNDISIRPKNIRSAANIMAERLSRELDRDDWQLKPRIFSYLQTAWGPHSNDRFATMESTQLPRFNATSHDPKCEDVDCLHIPDTAWQREANNCNPTWAALPTLCAKLHKPGALHPPSSHPTGPTHRGCNTCTTWPPRPSTTSPHATYSSPLGTARARGSDDQDGASWLFNCHAGLAAHPQRRNRAHTTDFQP